MKKLSTALVAASLLTLGACGGSEEAPPAANSVDEVNLATDDLTATDNSLENQADALGNEAGNGAGNVANAAEADVADTGNAADNALSNATGNSQ